MTRLSDMTTEEVRERAASAVVIQPVGAIEQHGPHLPLVTDALIAERTAERAVALLDDERFWVLPTLSYGTSAEHLGWPGTVSMSTSTMASVCLDVARSVAAAGCTRLVFVNGHGGQVHLLDMVARDIRVETGLMVFTVTPMRFGGPADLLTSDRFPIHGGQHETSVLLHLAPDLVHRDRFAAGGQSTADLFERLDVLTLENGVSPAWITSDVSFNGVIGDPAGATADLGRSLHEHVSARLADALVEIGDFAFPHGTSVSVPERAGAIG